MVSRRMPVIRRILCTLLVCALLSGLLVTELVYYYVSLSFVVPVVVGVLFTLLHALIQAYVLTTLTSMFYGETTEKHAPKPKKNKKIKAETVNN